MHYQLQFPITNFNFPIGVSIIRDQFSIGLLATATCRSDDVATKIEWLADGEVLKSRVSTRELELVFSPVNDSIHNSTYICRVFRESDSGVPDAEQNFTVRVDGEKPIFPGLPLIISVTDYMLFQVYQMRLQLVLVDQVPQ